MNKVEEFLLHAKENLELAEKALGAERARYQSFAKEWERLARYRLELIQYERELETRASKEPQ